MCSYTTLTSGYLNLGFRVAQVRLRGDFDADFDDFAGCFDRLTAPNGSEYGEGSDFDFDQDVDLFDFAGFQEAFAL
jgi:hypothetical protein